MITRTGTVHNENGIHCRPATQIAKYAKEYSGIISISNESGMEANPKSVLAILRLGLIVGDVFSVSVSGPDEERVCNVVMGMLEMPFDYIKEGSSN